MSSQYERLINGMVAVAGHRGYRAAAVTSVAAAAGLSRTAFYDHFSDREECFLHAYRSTVAALRDRIGEAVASAPKGSAPLATFNAAIDFFADDAASARILLIEAFAAPEPVRMEHELTLIEAECRLEEQLQEAASAGIGMQVPAVALIGGVGGIATKRVLDGDPSTLRACAPDLLQWIDRYAVPGHTRVADQVWGSFGMSGNQERRVSAPAMARLPRGMSAADPDEIRKSRRERIITAAAQLTATRGYAELTVAQIVAAAKVNRTAFYREFRDKESAVLAAQEVGVRGSMAAAASEFFTVVGWPERVWAAGRAMLEYIATEPELTRLELIEAPALGAAATRRTYDTRMAYAVFLEDGYRNCPGGSRPPRIASEAIANAIYALMRRQVVRERSAEIPEILPSCAYVALAPFMDPSAALEFVQNKVRIEEIAREKR